MSICNSHLLLLLILLILQIQFVVYFLFWGGGPFDLFKLRSLNFIITVFRAKYKASPPKNILI